ncbi:MAG: hypothetical protein D6770_08935 [Anaerolineae bacterium]|nr:MAG: hypothetical protein D6770_08935 [Anaerolineae bacterium]
MMNPAINSHCQKLPAGVVGINSAKPMIKAAVSNARVRRETQTMAKHDGLISPNRLRRTS